MVFEPSSQYILPGPLRDRADGKVLDRSHVTNVRPKNPRLPTPISTQKTRKRPMEAAVTEGLGVEIHLEDARQKRRADGTNLRVNSNIDGYGRPAEALYLSYRALGQQRVVRLPSFMSLFGAPSDMQSN